MAELELKFRLSGRHVKTALAVLERQAGARPLADEALKAVYFDTPQRELQAAGLALRVRTENGAIVQSVKRAKRGATAALQRDEWEDEIQGESPDLAVGKSGRAVRRVLGRAPLLEPQFEVVVTRRRVEIRKRNGACVEAAIDRGRIETRSGHEKGHGHRWPVLELELELKNGDDTVSLFDIALDLTRAIPLQLESRSKADRGYALLASGEQRPITCSPQIPLKQAKTLGAALKATGREYLEQFKSNMVSAAEKDEEAIHQMRVALRRLRGTLSFFKNDLPAAQYDWANGRLKEVLQALGPVRNWDVLRDKLDEIPDVPQRRTAAHRRLVAVAEQRKDASHERATHAVLSPAQTVALLELSRWFELLDRPGRLHAPKLDRPLRRVTDALLDRQFKRVRKRSRRFAELDADGRHKLRIACKNMRYNAELFGQFYPRRRVKRFVKRLKPAQDGLGDLNDVRSAHDLLTSLGRVKPRRVMLPAGKVIGWLDREAVETKARTAKTIKRLRNATPFW
jgi:triphosphatase